jgi:hypothetical protein
VCKKSGLERSVTFGEEKKTSDTQIPVIARRKATETCKNNGLVLPLQAITQHPTLQRETLSPIETSHLRDALNERQEHTLSTGQS